MPTTAADPFSSKVHIIIIIYKYNIVKRIRKRPCLEIRSLFVQMRFPQFSPRVRLCLTLRYRLCHNGRSNYAPPRSPCRRRAPIYHAHTEVTVYITSLPTLYYNPRHYIYIKSSAMLLRARSEFVIITLLYTLCKWKTDAKGFPSSFARVRFDFDLYIIKNRNTTARFLLDILLRVCY